MIRATIEMDFSDKGLVLEVLKNSLSTEIKGRAKIEFKYNSVIITAKDVNAFKIAVNSLIRSLKVSLDALEI